MIELHVGRARCRVSPVDGGRIAALSVDGRELLVSRQDDSGSMSWGCFPMAPWAGRVRNGSFQFDGNAYQLDLGLPPHAIHGTVFDQPWTVGEIDDHVVAMSCPVGDHWPFGGVVHQRIELADDRLRCKLSLMADQLPMPAQVGWHPCFRKPEAVTLRFARMYRRDADGIPTGELVEPSAGPRDDCFVEPLEPLELHYDDLVVTIDSDCDHWVIFDESPHATCVEPQSGPPDGPTLQPDRLDPGKRLARSMSIRWTSLPWRG
ncbi:MAG: aldose epimerase [Ilumatobacteraceae bacterium]